MTQGERDPEQLADFALREWTGRPVVKKSTHERIWEISRIRATPAAVLGGIAALDAKTAINEWIEKYQITDEEQQKRLAAGRVK